MSSIVRRLSRLVRRGGRLRVATSALLAGIGLVVLGLGVADFPELVPVVLFGALPFAVGLADLWGLARASESAAQTTGSATATRSTTGRDATAAGDPAGDPVSVLKARYARGDLEDDAFERKLDRLIEADGVTVDRPARAGDEADELAEPDR